MNYTKGEWDIHNQDLRYGDELIIHPQADEGGTYPFYCKVGGWQKVANAHLIAACPDMYEALKAVDDYLSAPYPENMKLKQIAANKLVSALAKAEGKE